MIPGFGLAAGKKIGVDYTEGADVGYRWFAAQGLKPLFPFGFGLSYTAFSHTGLEIADGAVPTAKLVLHNTGSRAGTDTAQLYLIARNGHAERRLLGWAQERLLPGESRQAEIKIDPRLLADFDVAAHGWHVPAGSYEIAIGSSAEDLPLHVAVQMGERRLPP